MTLAQAKALSPGQIVYHVRECNADGTPKRWKVNGRVRTWKRDGERVCVPVKHGLYAYGYIDEDCIDQFTL